MKKIVLTFGLICGAIFTTVAAIYVPLCMSGRMNFDNAEIVGYSSMVLAFLLVYFGIRTYRDDVAGGTITFGRAFKVGILITVVACAVYVVVWEIAYFNFIPDFFDRYAEHAIAKARANGATPAALEATREQMRQYKEFYANPLLNVAMTFMEAFPVGLIVTLVSAAILRKKPAEPVAALA